MGPVGPVIGPVGPWLGPLFLHCFVLGPMGPSFLPNIFFLSQITSRNVIKEKKRRLHLTKFIFCKKDGPTIPNTILCK